MILIFIEFIIFDNYKFLTINKYARGKYQDQWIDLP